MLCQIVLGLKKRNKLICCLLTCTKRSTITLKKLFILSLGQKAQKGESLGYLRIQNTSTRVRAQKEQGRQAADLYEAINKVKCTVIGVRQSPTSFRVGQPSRRLDQLFSIVAGIYSKSRQDVSEGKSF